MSLLGALKKFVTVLGLTATIYQQALKKKGTTMSEAPTAGSTAPIDAITSFATHPATAAVVQAVQAQMAPTSNWASVVVSTLGALSQFLSPVLQITRSSTATSAEVALGVAALEAVLQVFYPHPAAATQA